MNFKAFIKYGLQGEITNKSNAKDRIFGFSELIVREPVKQVNELLIKDILKFISFLSQTVQ